MILEHGIMGTPKELGYVHEALEREFTQCLGQDNEKINHQFFHIHSATCNEADSLDGIEIVMSFEKEFELSIPDEDMEQMHTLKDAIDYISAHVNAN